jgi:threonine/homoserine/homoserine lactone efflux protein
VESLLAYLAVTGLLVITPGSTTAVVVRNTVRAGRAAGIAAAVGAAAANTTHAVAAGLGLGLLLTRWPMTLTLVRVGGAAYLAWLGVTSVRRALVSHGPVALGEDGALSGTDARRGGFRQGLAVNMLNPAIATFYLVIVPSFVGSTADPTNFATLAAIHVAMALVCHVLWATGFHRLRRVLRAPGARRLLEGATGVALLGLAARLVA